MSAGDGRSRTTSWQDPLVPARAGASRSGLETMRAVAAGELPGPPIAHTLGFELVEVHEGRVVFAMEPHEFHYNPLGGVHGGVAATLLDSAMGCAVATMRPPGGSYTTLELSVNFVRPITVETGVVLAEVE